MKYTDRVIKHPLFVELMEKIKVLEASRIYCGHQLEHGMDVARIAWLSYLEDLITDDMQDRVSLFPKKSYGQWLEEKEEIKDLFYVCALLHDIGRTAQYETGVHHSIAGIDLAKQIMEDVQMPKAWVPRILDVVAEHSHDSGTNATENKHFTIEKLNLEYYIMKADHNCRLCFACEAKASCKWGEEEMNHTIRD